MAKREKLTVDSSMTDFKNAYQAKKKLVDREKEDFKFALGDQWSPEDARTLEKAGVKPITDNRIAPNLFLVTGLERQNRTDFKAFPEGEEDSVKAEVASSLFRHAIKQSGFHYKSSDQFKDGCMCGEAHLEMFLDYTDDLIHGKPGWKLLHGNTIFPEPGFSEYDFSDARYVYKVTYDVTEGDMINLYPKKRKKIREVGESRLDLGALLGDEGEKHIQKRDYPKQGEMDSKDFTDGNKREYGFDLIERYYKKWVKTFSIGDKKTGEIKETKDEDEAETFIENYKNQIQQDQMAYEAAVQQALSQHMATMPPETQMMPPEQHMQMMAQAGQMPPPPPQQDPERFIIIRKMVPEIWCYAHTPAIDAPLADERAWFYPKWKQYPFAPFYARFSTAPLTGDDRHLLVQGLVHGVKGVQEKHNKAEMLILRHLNSTANSGWDIEEGQMEPEEEAKLAMFGTVPGIVLKRRAGTQPLNRINPSPLSAGHAAIAAESAEAIKAQLGINADLLASDQGGGDSGRAIALRQRQGLLMIQELYDNLSRSRITAGRFLLSQLGEIYDVETAKKVLGESFLERTFPPPMLTKINPNTGMPSQEPMPDPKTGQPMKYDTQMADLAIADVLTGELGKYDVSVGEAVASESQKMAMAAEVQELAKTYPGMIPPDVLLEVSQIPQNIKQRVIKSIKMAQQAQAQAATGAAKPRPGDGKGTDKSTIEQAISG